MLYTTGNEFSAPHTDIGSSYPSELQLDSSSTRRDTNYQPDAVDSFVRGGHNMEYTAPELPYSLQKWTDNRPPRNFLGQERSVIAPVLFDPHLAGFLGNGTSSSAYGRGASSAHLVGIQRSFSPEIMSPQSIESPQPGSIFSTRSQSSSVESYQRSSAPTHTTYSLPGTMPANSIPILMDIPDLSEPDELISSQCFLKDILGTMCEERLRTREEFHDHMLRHFNGPPPKQALCIFCNLEFSIENPWSCWKKYLDHIRYQHFRNGMVIEEMRPDFVTLAYLRDTGVLPQDRYEWICELANERKFSENRVSPRDEARRLAEARQAEEENTIIIKERPTRRKHKESSGRQRQSNTQGQSSSQRAARGSSS